MGGQLRDDLSTAVAIEEQQPSGAVDDAYTAFITGLNTAATVAALAVAVVAVVCATMLRHIRPIASSEP